MIKLDIRRHIHYNHLPWSKHDKYVHRVMNLPFAPYVGLQLEDKDWIANISELYYDLPSKRFIAYTESDRRLCDETLLLDDEKRGDILAGIVGEHVADGWKIMRIFP